MPTQEEKAVADKLFRRAREIARKASPRALWMPEDQAAAFAICAAVAEILTPVILEVENLRKK